MLRTGIPTLGPATCPTPLAYGRFIDGDSQTCIRLGPDDIEEFEAEADVAFERAGPRAKLFFEPSGVRAAIVTCGGLCPGLNDVIHAIVMECHHNYKVKETLGVRFGLQGFLPRYGHPMVELTPAYVSTIHNTGGTVLGTSRGPQPVTEIVDALLAREINMLFVIGGEGTMKAAMKISDEVHKRRERIAVIGVPKTIDNDINLVTSSFGFDTAVEKAAEAIRSAHTEAISVRNGIGLVKLMGREAGFIAAQATLALKEVNYVLVPEAAFALHGDNGLLASLEARLKARDHAVIVVAEGAGQNLLSEVDEFDASGNRKLGDIAGLLMKEIGGYLKKREIPHSFKYIDPSYLIRSVPANANDRVYCGFLGQFAVHAAMAGKTEMVVSRLYDHYVHLPLPLVTQRSKKLNLASACWQSVLECTGQHHILIPKACG
ncbi:ATP-dependent 6-phosphofructokinase [Xanthobacteraceae bacterium Astr-EGSB]|uniref:ATP-dependent 6-phosphofructokinase n=1 Tax=Astrobacterium formosum TaxID=3069710 RepID=UPI0027B45285|nr:ATP-dependent 6-phosphofructokinase [Xanthobacteraceae bacterium Astr-EGSB]